MEADRMVLIVGGGIGGLTLGAALSRAGIDFMVYERAPALGEVGAGILVHPSAMRALAHIGLAEDVARAGQEIRRGTGRAVSGLLLQTTALDEVGAPTIALHRARLQATLLAAVRPDRVQTGKALVRYEVDREGAHAFFSDGTSARGALLVGADGIHSAVRRQLLGDTPLRYAGYSAWRGVARGERSTPADEIIEIWGRGTRFGIVPIGPNETYWFAVANAPQPGPRALPMAEFAAYGDTVEPLLRATPDHTVLQTDIHDREPVTSWSADRVVLLGDAAHPTTPNLGQGGCMAIEDAVTLAHCLTHHAELAQAIADYERRRMGPTSAHVRASWQLGRVAQLEGRFSTWLRDTLVRATPRAVVRKRLRDNAVFTLDAPHPRMR